MKAYWDSAALVQAWMDIQLRTRLHAEGGVTRTHALAEVFSTLTGGRLPLRLDADSASAVLDNLASDLEFQDLDAQEVLSALKQAQKRGVRGGRVHDYLHGVAADKKGVSALLTTDQFDFTGLTAAKVELV